jgi:hypothetical protein
MNAQTFTYLLENPEVITADQTKQMRSLIDEFPYFQSAHALYLKGLKNQESFTYNKALKVTAAHTTDRSVLFDYISSTLFSQNAVSTKIKFKEQHLVNIGVTGAEDVSLKVEQEELEKASQILNPDLFIEKKDSLLTPENPETTLEVGKPLDFDASETHSFSEWLKLAAFKPIKRNDSIEEVPPVSLDATKEKEEMSTLSRKRKEEIINSFIETKPKIKVSPSKNIEKIDLSKQGIITQESLMTETLARVYVEQKNYKKAKQAYRILSLKYPEKSGFFADQIRAIQQLEENKEL